MRFAQRTGRLSCQRSRATIWPVVAPSALRIAISLVRRSAADEPKAGKEDGNVREYAEELPRLLDPAVQGFEVISARNGEN